MPVPWNTMLSFCAANIHWPHLLICALAGIIRTVLKRIQKVDISKGRCRLRFLGHKDQLRRIN